MADARTTVRRRMIPAFADVLVECIDAGYRVRVTRSGAVVYGPTGTAGTHGTHAGRRALPNFLAQLRRAGIEVPSLARDAR